MQSYTSDDVPHPPAEGGVLAINASDYHHHFSFKANEVPNTLERIFCGTIPRKCFYVCTVEQFEAKARNKETIGWDLGFNETTRGQHDALFAVTLRD